MTTKEEFREFGRAMIDFVADYLENIRDRRVLPEVKPGYLKHLVQVLIYFFIVLSMTNKLELSGLVSNALQYVLAWQECIRVSCKG